MEINTLFLREVEDFSYEPYNYEVTLTNVHFSNGAWFADADGDNHVRILLQNNEMVDDIYCDCEYCGEAEFCEHVRALAKEIIHRIDNGLVVEDEDLWLQDMVNELREDLGEDKFRALEKKYDATNVYSKKVMVFENWLPKDPEAHAEKLSEAIAAVIDATREVTDVQASDPLLGFAALRWLGDKAYEREDMISTLKLQGMFLYNIAWADHITKSPLLASEIESSYVRYQTFFEESETDHSLEMPILQSLEKALKYFRYKSEDLVKFFKLVFQLNRNPDNWTFIDSMVARCREVELKYLNAESRGAGLEFLESNYQEDFHSRMLYIDRCMEKGEYEKALSLCGEYEMNPVFDKKVAILTKLGRIDSLKQLYARNFQGLNHYDAYKAVSTEEEWNAIVARLLSGRSSAEFRIDIYRRENRKADVLSEVKNEPEQIREAFAFLLPEHKAEASKIFEDLILKESESARTNQKYEIVVNDLKTYKNGGGDAKTLALKLYKLYPTRKKFQDMIWKYTL
ncbi:MAG: hypothetical protein LBC41_16975 [Clostridiales bacterium]|nr:hypothetical protein [Clostridiales bacterium]